LIPSPTTQPGPLTPEHLRALADARHRARRVRRAATIAAISGWSMAVFAGLTVLGVALGSMTSLVVSLALAAIAWNELRGGAMLRRLDPRGATRLGYNQIILGVLIVAYAAWSLFSSLGGDTLASLGGSTGDPQVDAMVADLSRTVAYALYATIALAGVLVPGLTAWYYFSRARIIRDVVARTPAWVLEALRASE
jgi:hypothetical protein